MTSQVRCPHARMHPVAHHSSEEGVKTEWVCPDCGHLELRDLAAHKYPTPNTTWR
jgi:rubrerythrin